MKQSSKTVSTAEDVWWHVLNLITRFLAWAIQILHNVYLLLLSEVKIVISRLEAFQGAERVSIPIANVADDGFARLHGKVYADYAGSAPYSEAALRVATQDLATGLYINPHNASLTQPGAAAVNEDVDRLRRLTLALCRANPSQYVCVLTSGATAALKLVAEAFPWAPGAIFLHLADNHNSVLGIREMAAARGASTGCISAKHLNVLPPGFMPSQPSTAEAVKQYDGPHLFAFPLESNFSGARYDEALITGMQTGRVFSENGLVHWHSEASRHSGTQISAIRWRVLVDAAKSCATHPPDLSLYPADFVALSYYKIFGQPTGLGALLIRRDVLSTLRRPYFGGGTVLAAVAEERFHRSKSGPEGFEDGTLPFLSIPFALRAFEFWQRRGGPAAAEAVARKAAAKLAEILGGLRHGNGTPVCVLYGSWNDVLGPRRPLDGSESRSIVVGQGPTVTFNLLNSDGSVVGYRHVERVATLEGIILRTGTMCNPGACRDALRLPVSEMKAWFEAGHVCGGHQDSICGVPTGAVRVSFGFHSSTADADAIAAMIKKYFVIEHTDAVPRELRNRRAMDHSHGIESIFVYPIKSAAGMQVRSWPVDQRGLLWDRHWALLDSDGLVLTLRRCPVLIRVHPTIDLKHCTMIVTAPGLMDSTLSITLPRHDGAHQHDATTTTAVNAWFSAALGMPCRLVQCAKESGRSFANQSRMLITSSRTLARMHSWAGAEGSFGEFSKRFRPNIILSGNEQVENEAETWVFEEDRWKAVDFGGVVLDISGPCHRCDVICIDPATGQRDRSLQPLRALLKQRGTGKDNHVRGICLGVLSDAIHLRSIDVELSEGMHATCLDRDLRLHE